MKLAEAINRRGFLKQTGGSIISLLLGKGLSQQTIQKLTSSVGMGAMARKPVAILKASCVLDYNSPLGIMLDAQHAADSLTQLLPHAKLRYANPEDGSDTFSFGVPVDSTTLQQLLARDDIRVRDEGDDEAMCLRILLPNRHAQEQEFEITDDPHDMASMRSAGPLGNVMKRAWEAAGKWSDGEEYARMDWVSDVPELMKLAGKLKLSPPAHIRSWTEFPKMIRAGIKDWGRQLDKYHREIAGSVRSRRDYDEFEEPWDPQIATGREGGMHQPFEARLRTALNALR